MRDETDLGAAAGGLAERRTAERLNPIDIHVGRQLRLRRTLLGLSQEDLAGTVGLTFQQVQKFERGASRISASRLWAFAAALDVPVQFFFRNMPEGAIAAADEVVITGAPPDRPPPVNENDPALQRETLELVRAFRAIPPERRSVLIEMARAMAEEGPACCGQPTPRDEP